MNIDFSSWNINITNNDDKDYKDLLNYFLSFSDKLSINFFLDIKKENFSFIEKIIYDIISFHCKNLNIDINDKYVSFWSKSNEYNFDYIHMHVDHCDYEARKLNVELKKTLLTTIIYLNDSDIPTLITDVTKDMFNKEQFNLNNNKLIFSFPKKMKSIVFDSNCYHGESYLSDSRNFTNRKVIVVALWDKINKPYYIPYFDNSTFNYFIFSHYKCSLDKYETPIFEKDKPIVKFYNTTDSILSIKTYDKTLINREFFYDLIIEKRKNIMYKFNKIISKFNNVDNMIINFDSNLLNN